MTKIRKYTKIALKTMVNVILSLKHILQMYLEGGLVVAEYKTITKKELTELLDKYPEDKEFNIIQTQLGMTIIPLGERIANKVDILEIANAAKTMIYSENKFMSQVDMHSVRQDIFNIERNGVMNTLLLPRFSNKE